MESKGLSLDKGKPIIFISHSSKDGNVAIMLADFLKETVNPSVTVFCSSLPGNDVENNISDEAKAALKASAVNIAILSRDYYQSPYCLNEAGVIWYRDDVPVVMVALPEINEKKIYGFFPRFNALRRLNSNTDIGKIYDVVRKAISAPHQSTSAIAFRSDELIKKYAEFLKKRPTPETEPAVLSTDDTARKTVSAVSENHDTANEAATAVSENHDTETKLTSLQDAIVLEKTTDDEKVVLYYMLKTGGRRVSEDEIREWLHENEIHGVNVDNAFYLLSSFDGVTVTEDLLELDINTFRGLISDKTSILSIIEECVNIHKKLASNAFKKLWENGEMSTPVLGLFIAYIIDEGILSFRNPKSSNQQIESIRMWERENRLWSKLSDNYKTCIEFFILNDFIYKSRCGDEYYLCPSLQELLFNNSTPYRAYLSKCKQLHKKPSLY